MESVYTSQITSLPLVARGKVRDIYQVGADHLLMVTTDRLSAFDVIFPTPVPGKGCLLNRISNFWFDFFAAAVPNHLTSIAPEEVVTAAEQSQVAGRAVVVRRLQALPVEAVVRGYLEGSGWKSYQEQGSVCGLVLPSGLQRAQQLEQPLFTPATKAQVGAHDENIDFQQLERLLGSARAVQVRALALQLYAQASAYALERGILIADTKFEFGLDGKGQLTLIDEVLTPDSSRFWPRAEYRIGTSPPSFDKQFVRNWLETLSWDKRPPAPEIPPPIISETLKRYREALHRLLPTTPE